MPPPLTTISIPHPILHFFLTQAYKISQTQPPTYYQSYHYATHNHSQPSPMPQITNPPPIPQITYPPLVPQITYLAQNSTNPQIKTEANPPLPSPPQIQEPQQQNEAFQSPEAPTPILTPSDSVEIITEK
jgi:hypothetical protein